MGKFNIGLPLFLCLILHGCAQQYENQNAEFEVGNWQPSRSTRQRNKPGALSEAPSPYEIPNDSSLDLTSRSKERIRGRNVPGSVIEPRSDGFQASDRRGRFGNFRSAQQQSLKNLEESFDTEKYQKRTDRPQSIRRSSARGEEARYLGEVTQVTEAPYPRRRTDGGGSEFPSRRTKVIRSRVVNERRTGATAEGEELKPSTPLTDVTQNVQNVPRSRGSIRGRQRYQKESQEAIVQNEIPKSGRSRGFTSRYQNVVTTEPTVQYFDGNAQRTNAPSLQAQFPAADFTRSSFSGGLTQKFTESSQFSPGAQSTFQFQPTSTLQSNQFSRTGGSLPALQAQQFSAADLNQQLISARSDTVAPNLYTQQFTDSGVQTFAQSRIDSGYPQQFEQNQQFTQRKADATINAQGVQLPVENPGYQVGSTFPATQSQPNFQTGFSDSGRSIASTRNNLASRGSQLPVTSPGQEFSRRQISRRVDNNEAEQTLQYIPVETQKERNNFRSRGRTTFTRPLESETNSEITTASPSTAQARRQRQRQGAFRSNPQRRLYTATPTNSEPTATEVTTAFPSRSRIQNEFTSRPRSEKENVAPRNFLRGRSRPQQSEITKILQAEQVAVKETTEEPTTSSSTIEETSTTTTTTTTSTTTTTTTTTPKPPSRPLKPLSRGPAKASGSKSEEDIDETANYPKEFLDKLKSSKGFVPPPKRPSQNFATNIEQTFTTGGFNSNTYRLKRKQLLTTTPEMSRKDSDVLEQTEKPEVQDKASEVEVLTAKPTKERYSQSFYKKLAAKSTSGTGIYGSSRSRTKTEPENPEQINTEDSARSRLSIRKNFKAFSGKTTTAATVTTTDSEVPVSEESNSSEERRKFVPKKKLSLEERKQRIAKLKEKLQKNVGEGELKPEESKESLVIQANTYPGIREDQTTERIKTEVEVKSSVSSNVKRVKGRPGGYRGGVRFIQDAEDTSSKHDLLTQASEENLHTVFVGKTTKIKREKDPAATTTTTTTTTTTRRTLTTPETTTKGLISRTPRTATVSSTATPRQLSSTTEPGFAVLNVTLFPSTRHRFSSRINSSALLSPPPDVELITTTTPSSALDAPDNVPSLAQSPDFDLSVKTLFNSSFTTPASVEQATTTNLPITTTPLSTTTSLSSEMTTERISSVRSTTTKRPKKKSSSGRKKSGKKSKSKSSSSRRTTTKKPPRSSTTQANPRNETATTTVRTEMANTTAGAQPLSLAFSDIESIINETIAVVNSNPMTGPSPGTVPRSELNALTPETILSGQGSGNGSEDATAAPEATSSTSTSTNSLDNSTNPGTNAGCNSGSCENSKSQYVYFNDSNPNRARQPLPYARNKGTTKSPDTLRKIFIFGIFPNNTVQRRPFPSGNQRQYRPSGYTTNTPPYTPGDYYVFGVYPNNSVVRRRGWKTFDYEKYHSPYVIFGIYPNNTIIKKFPNGTTINDEFMISDNEIRRTTYDGKLCRPCDGRRVVTPAGVTSGTTTSTTETTSTTTSTTTTEVPDTTETDTEEPERNAKDDAENIDIDLEDMAEKEESEGSDTEDETPTTTETSEVDEENGEGEEENEDENEDLEEDTESVSETEETSTDEPSGDVTEAEETSTDEPSGDVTEAEETSTDEPSGDVTEAEETSTDEPSEDVKQAEETSTDEPSEDVKQAEETSTDEPSEDVKQAEETSTNEPSEDVKQAEKTSTDEPSEDVKQAEETSTDEPSENVKQAEETSTDEPSEDVTEAEETLTGKPSNDLTQTTTETSTGAPESLAEAEEADNVPTPETEMTEKSATTAPESDGPEGLANAEAADHASTPRECTEETTANSLEREESGYKQGGIKGLEDAEQVDTGEVSESETEKSNDGALADAEEADIARIEESTTKFTGTERTTARVQDIEESRTEQNYYLEVGTTERSEALEERTTRRSEDLDEETTERNENLEERTTKTGEDLEEETAEKSENLEESTTERSQALEESTTEKSEDLEERTTERSYYPVYGTTESTDNFEERTTEKTENDEEISPERNENLEERTTVRNENLEERTTEQPTYVKENPTEQSNSYRETTTEQPNYFRENPTEEINVRENPTEQSDSFRESTTEFPGYFRENPTEQFNNFRENPTEQSYPYRESTTEQPNYFRENPTEQTNNFRENPTEQSYPYRESTTEQPNYFRENPTEQTNNFRENPTEQTNYISESPTEQNNYFRESATEENFEDRATERRNEESTTKVSDNEAAMEESPADLERLVEDRTTQSSADGTEAPETFGFIFAGKEETTENEITTKNNLATLSQELSTSTESSFGANEVEDIGRAQEKPEDAENFRIDLGLELGSFRSTTENSVSTTTENNFVTSEDDISETEVLRNISSGRPELETVTPPTATLEDNAATGVPERLETLKSGTDGPSDSGTTTEVPGTFFQSLQDAAGGYVYDKPTGKPFDLNEIFSVSLGESLFGGQGRSQTPSYPETTTSQPEAATESGTGSAGATETSDGSAGATDYDIDVRELNSLISRLTTGMFAQEPTAAPTTEGPDAEASTPTDLLNALLPLSLEYIQTSATGNAINKRNRRSVEDQDEPSSLTNLAYRALSSSNPTPIPVLTTTTRATTPPLVRVKVKKIKNLSKTRVTAYKNLTGVTATPQPDDVFIVTPVARGSPYADYLRRGKIKFVTLTPGVVVTTNVHDDNDILTMSSQHVQKVTKAPAKIPDNFLSTVFGEIEEKASSPIPDILKNVENELHGDGLSASLARRIITLALEKAMTSTTPSVTPSAPNAAPTLPSTALPDTTTPIPDTTPAFLQRITSPTTTTTTLKPTTTRKPKTTTKKPTTTPKPKPTTTTPKPKPTTTTTTTRKPTTTTTTTTTTKKPTTTTTTTRKPTTTTRKPRTTTTTTTTTTATTLSTILITPKKTAVAIREEAATNTLTEVLESAPRPKLPESLALDPLTLLLSTDRISTSTRTPSSQKVTEDLNVLLSGLWQEQGSTTDKNSASSVHFNLVEPKTKPPKEKGAVLPKEASNSLSSNDLKILEAILQQQGANGASQDLQQIVQNQIRLAEEVRKASRNLKKKPRPKTTTTTTERPPLGLGFLLNLFGAGSRPSVLAETRNPKRQRPLLGAVATLNNTNNPNLDPFNELDPGSPTAERSARGELVSAAIDVTKAVSKFMGTVLTSAAQSFQNFFRSFGR